MALEGVSLIWHGEREWNTTGHWQGILPVPLNDIGREQARKLALSLKLDAIEAIYTNNLWLKQLRLLQRHSAFLSLLMDIQHVAIVSHSGAIKMLLSVLRPGQAEAFHTYDIPNASITRLTCVDGVWQISDLGNVTHLGNRDSSDADAGVHF